MMDQKSGRFVILDKPEEVAAEAVRPRGPRPSLFIGERVQIKGVWFAVLGIKASGRVRLRMLDMEEVRGYGLDKVAAEVASLATSLVDTLKAGVLIVDDAPALPPVPPEELA